MLWSISLLSSVVSSASWGIGETFAATAAKGVSGGRGKKVGLTGCTVPVLKGLVRVTVKGSVTQFFPALLGSLVSAGLLPPLGSMKKALTWDWN